MLYAFDWFDRLFTWQINFDRESSNEKDNCSTEPLVHPTELLICTHYFETRLTTYMENSFISLKKLLNTNINNSNCYDDRGINAIAIGCLSSLSSSNSSTNKIKYCYCCLPEDEGK